VLHHPRVTVLSWAGAELVVVRLSRVSPSSFEGLNVEEVREWAAQCYGMTLAIPHSARTAPGMAVRVGRIASGSDSQAVSEATCVAGIRL
jgi:predicted ATPase